MNIDRWNKINEIFLTALTMAKEERQGFLNESCGDDEALKEEVRAMLEAHAEANDFIEMPAVLDAAQALAEDEAVLRIDERIGSYHVVKEIGRGGMGAVYLAERADEAYKKHVAIKLIKRGMDTEQVLSRFRNERQILANFDHPNIARLLEGGSTADGLPYFVMEFVQGRPIDVYCDENNLSITQRLELFLQVCEAVSYAHRNLVVHRDIKPTNILVTKEGVVKLLDFGIAKILQTNADRITNTGYLPMTPEYASPEQAVGGNVTTSADIYSLGILLYELLTGHLPYQMQEATAIEIAKIIIETKPQPPSTIVTTFTKDLTPAKVSKSREGTAEKLQRRLRGDLDNIVLKAIRKEPEQRYASIDLFSEDIRRHLAGLPVIARPVTLSYQLSKFIKRNKIAVALAALVFFTLIAGIIATTTQSIRAERERQRAEKRFNDVRKLAHSVVFDYHDAIQNLPGSTPVRARLVKDALEYLDSLASEENTDPSLQMELASAYQRIADVQGGTMKSNLGDTEGSKKSYRKAITILQSLVEADPKNKDARRKISVCSRGLGRLLWESGDLKGALVEVRKGIVFLQPVVDANPEDVDLRIQLSAAYNHIGAILLEQNDIAGALENHQKQLELYASFPKAALNDEKVRNAFSNAYEHIATDLISIGDLKKALENNQRSLEIRESLCKDSPLNADYQRSLCVSYYWQGEILWESGRIQEALENFEKDVEIAEKLLATDPKNQVYRSDLSYGLNRVGDLQTELGNPAQAINGYRRSQTLLVQDVEADPSNLWKRSSLIGTQAKLCKSLAKAGQHETAKNECAVTVSLMEKTTLEPTNAADRSLFADTYSDVGEGYSLMQQRQKSCEMYGRSLEIWQDLRDRGILSKENAGKIQTISDQMSKCS